PCAAKGVPRRELESVGGSRLGRMKQGEESAAVEKNQAQTRQRRADFFGHRKRLSQETNEINRTYALQNPRRSPSSHFLC
ncbi:MAG: hypothetical protein IKH51_05125, partial [Clostridia bacterium]|nr:hypothetical protein [Clostridia bacterium]